MEEVHGHNITLLIWTCYCVLQNGLLSSLPYLGKYVFAVLTSMVADYLLRTNKLSRTATRKLFTTFGKSFTHIPIGN